MFDISNIQVQRVIEFFPFSENQLTSHTQLTFVPNWKEINRYDSGKWKSLGLQHLSHKISTWRIQKLWLNGNMNSKIVKEIQAISFPQLKVLLLNTNNLCSIQTLSNLFLPNLEHLNLAKNYISELKIVRKGNWPSLTFLSLSDNKLRDFDALSELKASYMKEIVIQTISSNETRSATWVAKVESQCLESLWIRSKKRIRSEKVASSLKNKSQDMVINYAK